MSCRVPIPLRRHAGCRPQACFSEVITNPAEFRDGALRVAPRHTLPHGCALCPANLCKGQASSLS